MKDNIPIEKQIQQSLSELEVSQKEVKALKVKLDAAPDEKQYRDIRLSYDYNKLQVEKLQKKIEEAEKQKSEIQDQLDVIEKQIAILECVLDSHQLTKDAENWQNRRDRAVERVLKVIKDRDALNTLRKNLNQRWNDLNTKQLPKEEASAISPYSQDKPVKPDELCEALALKADADVYFL